MRRPVLLLPALVLGLACQHPQVAAVAQQHRPVAVTVSLPATVGDRTRLEGLYADAIRARLAGRVNVADPAAALPPNAAGLMVVLNVDSNTVSSEAVEGFHAGFQTGFAYKVGAGKEILPALGDGLLTAAAFGVISGAGSSLRELHHELRLGYRPKHIRCDLVFKTSPDGVPMTLAKTDSWEVVKAMLPLTDEALKDPDGLHREEARALASVVVKRMERNGWELGNAPALGQP